MQENGEGGMVPAPTPRRRITWTQPLVDSLLELSEEAEPTRRGYHARLQDYWNLSHPTLPSTSAALVAKLSRNNKSAQEAERVSGDEAREVMNTETPVESQPDPKDAIKDRLETPYSEVSGLGPDSLSKRERLAGRWTRKDPTLVSLIDQEIARLYGEHSEKNLWILNCLIYAGDKVASELAHTENGNRETEEEQPSTPESEIKGDEADELDILSEEPNEELVCDSESNADTDSDSDSTDENLSEEGEADEPMEDLDPWTSNNTMDTEVETQSSKSSMKYESA